MIEAESRDGLLGVIFGFVLGSTGVASIAGTVIRSTGRGHRENSDNKTKE